MSGDDDDISVISTAPSEEQSEYEVETILSERKFDDDTMYLVKWAGYPLERCTWEPADSFFNEETFADWKKKKKAIAEGKRPEFDLESWEKHLIALEEARDQRKRRRGAKRRRLGLSRAQTDALEKQRVDANTSSSEPSHPSSTNVPLPAPVKGPARTHSPNRPPAVRHLPPRPPMVMFGTQDRQRPWMAARHKRPADSEGTFKPFLLSTKWRHDKAKRYEPPPDINQLELARPSDWPPRMRDNAPTPKLGNRLVSSPKADSPLPSPQERNNSAWASDRAGFPYQNRPSDTWIPEPLQPRQTWGPERSSGDPGRPENPDRRQSLELGRTTTADTWRPDYQIPGDPSRDQQHIRRDASRPEDSNRPSPPDVNYRGGPEARLAVQTRPENGNTQNPSHEEPIPSLPARRQATIKGANNRRARDDNFQSRFWNPGEIFCCMYFGPDKKSIGPVRLCGLNSNTRSRIMQSKQGRGIDIWFQEICTLDDYRELCSRVGTAPKMEANYSNSRAYSHRSTPAMTTGGLRDTTTPNRRCTERDRNSGVVIPWQYRTLTTTREGMYWLRSLHPRQTSTSCVTIVRRLRKPFST